jgi:hypothetical protein
MKYTIFLLFLIACSPKYSSNKSLYKAEVEIVKTNGKKDTLSIVYFDYIYHDVETQSLYKKNGSLIEDEVRKYKIIKKIQTKL